MNMKRRAAIAQAIELMDQAYSILTTAQEEEQEYFDNMPESLQNREKGELATAWLEALDSATSNLSYDKDTLEAVE